MKIGIDVSQTVYQRGVGRYTRELVYHLLKIDSENQYSLFGGSLRQQKALRDFINSLKPNTTNLTPKLYPIPPTLLELLFNKIHLSIDSFIGRVDVFHSSDWTQPASKAKKVTTIHDLIAVKFPKLFDSKIIAVQKRRLKWVKTEVDKIIAVSKNTKKDIVEVLQIPEEKISLIYEAASPIFYKRKVREIEAVKKKYKIKKNYLLTVNTRSSQKLTKLLEAFEKIRKNFDINLVVVGENIIAEKVISLGFISDEDLARLYSGAAIFIFTSFYEGFGLPVIEAMNCGTPVICSNSSSLPEIGGDGVLYVNPDSKSEVINGVKKILENKKFTQELSRRGLNQVEKFSWEKTARETLKVYEELFYDYRS